MITLPPKSPKILPLDWQSEASREIVCSLTAKLPKAPRHLASRQPSDDQFTLDLDAEGGLAGVLLRAGTGTGKMYMCAEVCRMMLEQSKLAKPRGSINPFPILWLTPKSVKIETQRVIHLHGLTNYVMVMSYSEIKTSLGGMYLEWLTIEGEPMPFWRANMLPSMVVCDEYQVLKNPDSLQSRVIRAIPATVKCLAASATPFQRCIDATTMLERFGCITDYNAVPTTNETSHRTLAFIASPKNVHEYSPAAVERLRTQLDSYIVELKNVRFKHQSRTKCITIQFKTPEERNVYNRLVQTLIDNLHRRRARDPEFSYIHFLVEMQKMQQGAELLRCNQIVERAIAKLPTKAVIIASNYVDTLDKCYSLLIEHGINPDRIAVVKGGQKAEDRAQVVSEFQQGKRDIVLFTMRSGGVGISLHHDRPTTKPRYIILPPTWSAIDLVQALGRGHRLTSLSITEQEILWYGGTIEDAVQIKVALKIKCLSKAVTAKEQFIDTFVKQIDDEIDSDSLAEAVEQDRHTGQDDTTDDLDSDDDSLTGEGLDS